MTIKMQTVKCFTARVNEYQQIDKGFHFPTCYQTLSAERISLQAWKTKLPKSGCCEKEKSVEQFVLQCQNIQTKT